MTIKNFSWNRAKKFYFGLIAFGGALVSGNVFHGGVLTWVTAILGGLGAAAIWLFPQDPPAEG